MHYHARVPRPVVIAAAQLGPIARADTRAQVVERMLGLLRDAHAMGAQLVVFPELALTTFFPLWFIEDPAQLDAFYERAMPNPATIRNNSHWGRSKGFCRFQMTSVMLHTAKQAANTVDAQASSTAAGWKAAIRYPAAMAAKTSVTMCQQ